jgi:CRP-like cAMP-binding protein
MYDGLIEYFNRFIPLSPSDFEVMKEGIEVRHIAKKEHLIKAGETEEFLYFISKGLAREYIVTGKQEVTTDLICEGTITGSATSFLGGEPSRYNIQAMEPMTALVMSKHSLEKLYRSGDKWEKLGRLLTTHFLLQQEKHILDKIRFSVKERFLKFLDETPGLVFKY